MIKIANNLEKLISAKQAEEASNSGGSSGVGRLALVGAGAAGALGIPVAKTIAAIGKEYARNWMKNPDGSYTRRMSTLADRPIAPPMRFSPGRAMLPPSSQVNLEAYRRALDDESLERMRVRIREQWKDNLKPIDHPDFIAWEKDKANHTKALARAYSIIDPAQRIRIDEAALRGPKPPTSVFTDPDLFSNIFKRLRRFGR